MMRVPRRASVAGLGLGAMVIILIVVEWSLATPSTGSAEEFRFVIQDVEGNLAAWSPREVVIHKNKDLEGGLVFVLENPTSRTHVFEAPGLFEQIVGERDATTVKPLRVTVAAGETMQIRVSTAQFSRSSGACAEGEHSYRFFCPLHKGDADMGSAMRVVP